jgi:hypothetical protein
MQQNNQMEMRMDREIHRIRQQADDFKNIIMLVLILALFYLGIIIVLK